jgi:hypothetical protein
VARQRTRTPGERKKKVPFLLSLPTKIFREAESSLDNINLPVWYMQCRPTRRVPYCPMGQATATDVWRTPRVSTTDPPTQASFGRTTAIPLSGHLPRMLSEDWTTQVLRDIGEKSWDLKPGFCELSHSSTLHSIPIHPTSLHNVEYGPPSHPRSTPIGQAVNSNFRSDHVTEKYHCLGNEGSITIAAVEGYAWATLQYRISIIVDLP